MRSILNCTAVIGLALASGTGFAANHDPLAIIPLLANSRLSLIDGIKLAEQSHGPAISAKFEIADDGKLVLSVYNIPEGLAVEPEAATMLEVSVDPTVQIPQLNVEVFQDKKHLTRSASHMTLFRLSKLTLIQALDKAARLTGGVPIDARDPTVVNHRPIVQVVMMDAVGGSFNVIVDLGNGRVKRI